MAEALAALAFGAFAGSFANVAIHRLPRYDGLAAQVRSLVGPRSHCPHCGRAIRPWDNIPLVSFALLRGRCRTCGGRISWRYPVVEAVTALLFLAVWLWFGVSVEAFRAALFALLLVIVIFVDLRHRLIPNGITYPGTAAGLLLALPAGLPAFAAAFLTGLAAGAAFLLIAVISERLLGQVGMGGGDIKLAAMMGVFLGWPVIVVALFFSFTLGGAAGLALLAAGARGRRDPVPFGPFMAAGALIALFWGEPVIRWYLG